MKKMNIMLAAGAFLLPASATAQEKGEFQKNNWFLTAGAHTEAMMNTNGYVTGTGKVGAGIWFNPWAGIKLEGVAGNTHLLTNSRGQVFGAELSYMAHLYGGKEYKPFNLNGVLGMGFYHHKFGTILEKYSYMNILIGNLGVQAVYNITPRWSVYLKPGLLIQPKYYDVNNKDKVMPSFYVNVGLSYTFEDMFENLKKKDSKRNRLQSTKENMEWLNQQINDMRSEVERHMARSRWIGPWKIVRMCMSRGRLLEPLRMLRPSLQRGRCRCNRPLLQERRYTAWTIQETPGALLIFMAIG